jgi:hypothetical protein
MNTGFRISHFAGLFQATLVSAVLLAPTVSQAQVFFASGGTTNTVPNTASNQAFGYQALFSNTTGQNNVAIGFRALFANTTGFGNTASGYTALTSNTTGSNNTANGWDALEFNTIGQNNTADGFQALYSNTEGNNNTANGVNALYSNTTGSNNTASGIYALGLNKDGTNNTANGYAALLNNVGGGNNTANGFQALFNNTTGFQNTADGVNALYSNTSGFGNTANGIFALANNITGSNNIGIGYGAGGNLTTGNSNIAIGNFGIAAESGAIRIGTIGTHTSAYISGISGVTVSGGVGVFINGNGQLGTLTSSRRFKSGIKDMGNVSDKLMQLRPVTFRYKDTAEKGPHSLQYGLIAEEVAKVYPELVQYDKSGKPFTIYYHLLTPMLLNELQKVHRQNEAQKAEITAIRAAHKSEITALKSEIASLKQAQQQQLNALTKLTARMETSQNKAQVQRLASLKH